ENLAHGLSVRASGPVVAEDVAVAGQLTIDAPAINVHGTVHGSALTLDSSGWVTIEVTGTLTATNRIDVHSSALVNSGQLHVDGVSGGQIVVNATKILNSGRLTATGSVGSGGTVWIAATAAYVETAAARIAADGGPSGAGGSITITAGTTGRLYSSG